MHAHWCMGRPCPACPDHGTHATLCPCTKYRAGGGTPRSTRLGPIVMSFDCECGHTYDQHTAHGGACTVHTTPDTPKPPRPDHRQGRNA